MCLEIPGIQSEENHRKFRYHTASTHIIPQGICLLLLLEEGGRWPLLSGKENSRVFGELTNLRRKKYFMTVKVTKTQEAKILIKRRVHRSEHYCWFLLEICAEFLNCRGQENSQQGGTLFKCRTECSKSLRADQTKTGDQKPKQGEDLINTQGSQLGILGRAVVKEYANQGDETL